MKLPYLRKTNGRSELMVNGKPFIILGFQWSCDLSSDEAYVESYLPYAREMGCNTVVIPVYWRDVEPSPGNYRLEDLRKRIFACRENGLKMGVLWFGAYKNAQLWYVPDWVYRDEVQFPRVVRKNGEIFENTACPLGKNTLQRDKAAFLEVLKEIQRVDSEENTVIVVQIENEAGLLATDRCYCGTCSRRYAEEGWKEAEEFTATCMAEYIGELAEAGKALYPLPFYANAWLDMLRFDRPGADYPSGGPNMKNLRIYAKKAPHLDFVAPDTYEVSYRDFTRVCRAYAEGAGALYIAEHHTGDGSRAEKNIFYALGEYAGIGFDPYCINNNEDPVVTDKGAIAPRIHPYIDSLRAINGALPVILEARGTPRLKGFVQEDAEKNCLVEMGKYAFLMEYKENGRGMVIKLGEEEYVILGTGFNIRVCSRETSEMVVPSRCEWGEYGADGNWVKRCTASRESLLGFIPFHGPGVVRMWMDTRLEWDEHKKVENTQ